MAVGVQRERDIGMAEALLHDLWVNASLQKEGRVCVPKVMKPNTRKPRAFDDAVKRHAQVVLENWLTEGCANHEVIVFPRRTHHESVSCLFGLVSSQQIYDGGRKSNRTSARFGFWLFDTISFAGVRISSDHAR